MTRRRWTLPFTCKHAQPGRDHEVGLALHLLDVVDDVLGVECGPTVGRLPHLVRAE